MKVLAVIAEMHSGGAQAVVAALAEDVLTRGGDVLLASAGGRLADRLAAGGVRTTTLPLTGRSPHRLAAAAAALHREVAAFRPDLLHTHNVKATLVARLARGRSPIPVVATLHGVADAEYGAAARILRRCADHVVAVSDFVAARLCDAGFPAQRVTVVPNAITPPALPGRAAARRALGLPAATPVALCVARLVPQKRQDLLVQAWRDVPAPAVLLLAGDGPTGDALQAAVVRAGLGARVRLLGDRADVPRLLAAADVSVLPTDWEGLPISVLEAFAAGVPVVASRVGGLAAVAGAAELVEPGSVRALAAAVRRVLADRAHRDALVAAGAALVADRFAPATMLAGYAGVYAQWGRATSGPARTPAGRSA